MSTVLVTGGACTRRYLSGPAGPLTLNRPTGLTPAGRARSDTVIQKQLGKARA